MTTPITLLTERLEEISKQLQNALNYGLAQEEVNRLCNIYNEYYIAIQLIGNHLEQDIKIARLHEIYGKKIVYSVVSLKNHLKGLEEKAEAATAN